VAALTAAQSTFREQQAEIDRLAAERRVAQEKLDAARSWSEPASVPAAALEQAAVGAMVPMAGTASGPSSGDRWDPAAAASGTAPGGIVPPYGKLSEWDLTLPMVPSAFLSGDPIQIINAVLQIAQNSYQTTQQLGKKFLQQMGILKPTDTGITNGAIPVVAGSKAVEHVIARAMSQRGVPYSWGGGNAAGASRGIDSGAGTVGFDCSGLVAHVLREGGGLRVKGSAADLGRMSRPIDTTNVQPGDLVFFNTLGARHSHVGVYVGDGRFVHASNPRTGVRIDAMSNRYYAQRFEGAHSLLD
jgi:cell wall-associated NlpC family hydrolase